MSNPVAIITGASRGIGKQVSVDLARAGYDVVCAARSTAEHPSKLAGTVDETAALVEQQGRRALAVALDVRDEDAVAALAERVYGEWGRCDLVVNNAAVAPPGRTLELPTKRWRLAVDVNLNGPLYLTWHFGRRMVDAGGGRIINISSGAAQAPEFGRASYTVTKVALESLTECMAYELRGSVAVNCIRIELMVWSEGFVETLGDGDFSMFEDPVILGDAVTWLAGQPVDYTGEILTIARLRELGAVRPPTTVRSVTGGPGT